MFRYRLKLKPPILRQKGRYQFYEGLKFSAIFLGASILLFFGFWLFEQKGDAAPMPWIFAVIYLLGGKWLALGIFGGIGALILFYSLFNYFFHWRPY